MFFPRWPLLAVAVALVTTYVTMAEVNRGDEGPRTFVAALAAVTVGAWLYSLARGDEDPPGGKN
jgi:hypothetical protein